MVERDRRFGGNLERATIGKQYSRAYPGGPPGVDQRYEDYQAPHRVDYTSPGRPIQTGTPNFRPPSGGGEREGIEQIPSGNFLRRLFGDLRNQAFGPQGVQSASVDPFAPQWWQGGDPFDPRRLGIEKEEFDPFNPPVWTDPETYDPFNNQLEGLQEQAAVPQDDWRTWDKIIKAGENPDDYEVETSDASDWLDYIPGNPYSKNKIGQLPIDLDPFQGTVGFDKQFDLPFGGTGNIEADYDLNDQRFKTGIMGNWTWG